MSGLFKGPLPVLILAGAVFLAYKYVPFAQVVDRFRQAEPVSATATAPSGGTEAPVAVSVPAGGDQGSDRQETGPAAVPPEPRDGPSQPTTGVGDAAADVKAPRPILAQNERSTIGLSNEIAAVKPDERQGRQPIGIGAPTGGDSVGLAGTVGGLTIDSSATTGIGQAGGSIPPKTAAVDPVSVQAATPTAKPPTEKPTVVAARAEAPVAEVATDKNKAAVDKPAAKPKPESPAKKAGVANKPATVVAKVDKPVVPSKPVAVVAAPPAPAPPLRILVEAEVHDRAGTDQYTPAEYAAMLRKELIAITGGYLGAGHVGAADANMAFRDDLADGRSGVDRLCARAGSERLLLADLDVPSEGFSTIDSAYWPEVVFTAINCRDGRLHKSQKARLEPSHLDRFEYQQGFAERSQRFVASQAYFLRP